MSVRYSTVQYNTVFADMSVQTCQPFQRGETVLRLNTVLRAVSGNSREGASFQLNKQTWRRKQQWYTEDDFPKSRH